MSDFKYVGSELELFAEVRNWPAYRSATLQRYINGDVLEAGAGIGSNTAYLDTKQHGRWVCLEPDAQLVSQLTRKLSGMHREPSYEIVCGTLSSLDPAERFDTVLYIDVLEHIEDDYGELVRAASLLRPGGRIVVQAPAHQRLYTEFDRVIGHFRRYDRRMIKSITPPQLQLERALYLDSAGILLSAGNLMLRQSYPTKEQLQIWDSLVIPVSRVLDKFTFHALGKAIVAVWIKKG